MTRRACQALLTVSGDDWGVELPVERRYRIVAVVTLIAYLVIGFVPYAVSGLIVPNGAVGVLMACWLGGLLLTIWLAVKRPLLAPVGVVAALLFWYAFITLGSSAFGWSP